MTAFFPLYLNVASSNMNSLRMTGIPCNNSSIGGSFTRRFYSCLVCVETEVLIMRVHTFSLVLYRAFMKIENRQTADPCF